VRSAARDEYCRASRIRFEFRKTIIFCLVFLKDHVFWTQYVCSAVMLTSNFRSNVSGGIQVI